MDTILYTILVAGISVIFGYYMGAKAAYRLGQEEALVASAAAINNFLNSMPARDAAHFRSLLTDHTAQQLKARLKKG